jgi:glycosyltransferase involved in cell wall biosynthesis
MSVSVIISTRNRASRLDEALRRLTQVQDPGVPCEIVVVDNNSTDGTADVVRRWEATSPIRVVGLRETRGGKALALNAGIAASRGELLFLTDDDCYVAPDCLAVLCRVFAEPTIGAVGGRVLLFDPDDARITIQESTLARRLERDLLPEAGVIHGANMGFRREALLLAGGFDALMGPGTEFVCEDIDAISRVHAVGWDVLFEPSLVVWHHHGRTSDTAVAALHRVYDYGRGAYLASALLDPRRRGAGLRAVYWGWKAAPLARSVRELLGGVLYVAARIRAKLA